MLRCTRRIESLRRSFGKSTAVSSLCLCRPVFNQKADIVLIREADRCIGRRRRCRVRDRESIQMILMEFLTVEDRYCFNAAARAELFVSFTRCPCGCYELQSQLRLDRRNAQAGSSSSSCRWHSPFRSAVLSNLRVQQGW